MTFERTPAILYPLFGLIIIAFAHLANGAPTEDMLVTKGFEPGRRSGAPIDTIVLHFSSNVGENRENPYDVRAVVKVFEQSNSSAHYLIGRQGKIYRLVKETDTAYHAGNGVWGNRTNTLNHYSIGIELLGIGTFKEMHALRPITTPFPKNTSVSPMPNIPL